ncbi:MAG: DUF5320 family protein [Patescibacteria group bacterium]
MPNYDGTGPQGQGPGTGQRMGNCGQPTAPRLQGSGKSNNGRGTGRGQGQGLGRGRGRGIGRGLGRNA